MKKRLFCILVCTIYSITCSAVVAPAETPSAASPDIGAYEHGYSAPTPVVFPEEEYDGAAYGEQNTSLIFVSVTGSDETGDGSPSRPYATLNAAANAASPGTTIRMGAGVYELTNVVELPLGVSVEGAVPCGDSFERTNDMTVLTSSVLTEEFEDVLLRLQSEPGPNGEKAEGAQHISNICFDGEGTAAQAIEVRDRSSVAIHDCTVVSFARIGVGFSISDIMDGGDGEPIPILPPAAWATGCRFFNNYMKDNSYYGPDAWGNSYGRGALFCCGLQDLRIYNNTIIEDCRTAPADENGAHIRGVPVKFWYFNSWMLGCKIHDNVIQKLGSTVNSSDGDGWDFAIESCSHVGMEIYANEFIGAVDLNAGMLGSYGGEVYEYATWIHDNSFSADPTIKIDGSDYEEWAIVLERLTQKTVIERNTVTDCNTFVYFNMRDSITDVVIRYNSCAGMSAGGGTMIRLDGVDQEGTQSPMVVSDLAIYNNILQTRDPDFAGFAVFLGQEMWGWTQDWEAVTIPNAWRGQNITIANNIISGPGYEPAIVVGKTAEDGAETLAGVQGLNIENNLFHGVTDICAVNCTGGGSALIADNILATEEEWASAFEEGGWHPALNSVLIDAGKVMGALTDAWNNPILGEGQAEQPVIPGDVNGDGMLTFADVSELYLTIISNNTSAAEPEASDFNGDGIVSFSDITALYLHITAADGG